MATKKVLDREQEKKRLLDLHKKWGLDAVFFGEQEQQEQQEQAAEQVAERLQLLSRAYGAFEYVMRFDCETVKLVMALADHRNMDAVEFRALLELLAEQEMERQPF